MASGYLEDMKESADILGSDYILPKEARVSEFVGKCLSDVTLHKVYFGNQISKEILMSSACKSILLLGRDIEPVLNHALENASVNYSLEVQRFNMGCTFSFDYDVWGRTKEDSIRATLSLPQEPLEIDGMVLGHELIHLLKDSNYKELISTLYTEALPIFFELVCYDNELEFADKVLKIRLGALGRQYDFYKEQANESKRLHEYFGREFKGIGYRKSLEEYGCSVSGSYLNGFYIAMILYKMYKNSPKKVLEYVKAVLFKKIITKGLCDNFEIVSEKNDETFLDEFEQLKKVLK